METINPKNFIDIDPTIVSFITLKNGNMIVIDESTPAKSNKEKKKFEEEEEKNNNENIDKPKQIELTLSEQINLSFIGNEKKIEATTIIKKNDFNLISSIIRNINFSIINKNSNIQKNNNKQNANFNQNYPSPNSSIDIKSSMFQSRRDNLNINNITNTNNNILSEDNVNIHLTDTIMSNQINHNNGKNNEGVMSLNTLMTNMTENNLNNKNNNLNKANNIILDTQKYTFDDNNNNDNGKNINKEDNIANNNQNIVNNPNEINLNNNGIMNNFNSINNHNEQKDKIPNFNNPSLIMQNNNFYSQNNFPINNISLNEPNKNNLTEANINNSNENDIRSSKKYKRLNRLRGKKRDNNYVKAVVSINIPGEEQEGINLVKQFNLLVDRLNGQKSHAQAKENIKRSDRYYELYKNNNENIINSFLSPGKSKKRMQTNSFFDISNITHNTKLGDINSTSSIYNNDISIISNKKNNFNNLNSRILALKERTFNSLNNSFRNDNIKDNNNNNNINNSEIVLPSNFAYRK